MDLEFCDTCGKAKRLYGNPTCSTCLSEAWKALKAKKAARLRKALVEPEGSGWRDLGNGGHMRKKFLGGYAGSDDSKYRGTV